MKSGKLIYCWDTSILLYWLKGENNDKELTEGIAEAARLIDGGEAYLVASQMLRVEILQGTLSQEAKERLDGFWKRSNVVAANLDSRIASLASELRDTCNNRGLKLTSPDAIHIATAVENKADEFHTNDSRISPTVRQLIAEEYQLKICRPRPPAAGNLFS